MPAAKIVGNIGTAHPAPVNLSGPVTLEALSALIDQKLAAQNSANVSTTAAAVAAVKPWEPSADEFIPNQKAYPNAPAWKPGASYWKTGSKPEGATIL